MHPKKVLITSPETTLIKRLFITIALLLTYVTVSFAQQDTLWFDSGWKKTTKDNAHFYRLPVKKEKRRRYRINDFYIDGTKQMTGLSRYKDSVHLEGKAVWYDKNGKITQEKTYKDNVLHGVSILYKPRGPYGSFRETKYKNGKREKEVFFGVDRKGVRYENYMKEGRIFKSVYYDNEGKLIGSYHFNNNDDSGEGIQVSYYSDPMRVEKVKTIKDGYEVYSYSFYPNGQKRSSFDTDRKKETFYDEKGNVMGALQYEGKPERMLYLDGTRYEFYHDGRTVKKAETYEEGYQLNQKEYNTFGILICKEIFEDNEVVKTISYTDEGEKLGVLTKRDGILNGTIREKNNNIITYRNNEPVKAVVHYRNSDKVFASLENSVISYYDTIGNPLGKLRVKVERGKFFPNRLENGGYSPTPVEGTLFNVDYKNRISLKTQYKNGKKTEKASYKYRKEAGVEEEKCFKETEIYNESGSVIKRITYFSNGNKKIEKRKPNAEENKDVFFDKTGKQIAEYDYKTKTGTLYIYFPQSDAVQEISKKKNGDLLKRKRYQQVYDKALGGYKTVLREDIDINNEAKFYSRQGKLIAGVVFTNGKPTGTFYDFKSGKKAEMKNGVKHGAYIDYAGDEKTIRKQGYYVNGEKHGTFINFVYGIKQKEENFKYGKKEGYTIYYDKKGNEVSRLLYRNNKPYEGRKTLSFGNEKVYEEGAVIKEIRTTEIKERDKYVTVKTVTEHLPGRKKNTTVYDPDGNTLLTYITVDNLLHGKVVQYEKNKPRYKSAFYEGELTKGTIWVKCDTRYRSEAYSRLHKKSNTVYVKTYNKDDQLLFSAEINPGLYKDYGERVLSYKLGMKTNINKRDLFITGFDD